MVELTFLGSGGGRFMTITQKRSTGGFLLEDGVKVHVDPGPGALVKSWQHGNDPRELDAIAVSHCHIDHCNDCSVLIEAMTNGVTRQSGVLIGSESLFTQNPGVPVQYTEKYLERKEVVKAGDMVMVEHLVIKATPTIHSDPTTVGFVFETSQGNVSYISDTQFFPDLTKWHRDARVLIANVTRPARFRIPYHLTTTDAIKIASDINPELVVMSHIGMKMHMMGVEEERRELEEKTAIRTIVADEGKKILMDGSAITTSL
jgi:phosphoribosyl 1,2-cyclic phosphodiesterase